MNPIKRRYGFVDLLKPESGAVVPVLLALDPRSRKALGSLATVLFRRREARPGRALVTAKVPQIASGSLESGQPSAGDEAALRAVVAETMGEAADAFLSAPWFRAAESAEALQVALSDEIQRGWGTARLLLRRANQEMAARIPDLILALRGLYKDRSFDQRVEGARKYLRAAEELVSGGRFSHVVFGHTHLAKSLAVPGGFYLNTGTWANLMSLPLQLFSGSEQSAIEAVSAWLNDLEKGNLADWLIFRPSYATIDLDGSGRVLSAVLCVYDHESRGVSSSREMGEDASA